jgi:beta-N-acetylhexosaminidase
MRRQVPVVLVGNANYPAVTRDAKPASMSKKWISDVLRKRIGYRGLVVSDDMEMGALLKSAPIEEAAIEFIRAGGDICLICRQQELIERAYQALINETERDRQFSQRVRESVANVLAFKRKSKELKIKAAEPTVAKVQQLSRSIWELGEQVRLGNLKRQAEA